MKQATIRKRFAEAAAHLGLADWKFSLQWGDDAENHASVAMDPYSQIATVYLNLSSMAKESRKENADTIVHELWHVKLSPFTKTIRKLLPKRGRKVLDALEERMVREIMKTPLMRQLVNHLARK